MQIHLSAESEPGEGCVQRRLIRHVELQVVDRRRQWHVGKDLLADEDIVGSSQFTVVARFSPTVPTSVGVEVDPRVQRAEHRGGYVDFGLLPDDQRRDELDAVLIVDADRVVPGGVERRQAVHFGIDAGAQEQ